ncbi:hypothetical protein [Streptomyces globisporus]|uniref:hypothetical protein n=1 Tax=Streptomyces globisporus TaxID=1908 RepID=UPI0034607368
MVDTSLSIADLLDRLERPFRPCAGLIDLWHTAEALSADVPALADTAHWLLDQIALRDAPAQQIRAVLEPDITDYLRDQNAPGRRPDVTLPTLDAPRSSQPPARPCAPTPPPRTRDASRTPGQLQDAFPVTGRPLATSGPAALWRQNSATARDAVDDLTAQRIALTAEEGTDHFADPELLHAQTSYLAARGGPTAPPARRPGPPRLPRTHPAWPPRSPRTGCRRPSAESSKRSAPRSAQLGRWRASSTTGASDRFPPTGVPPPASRPTC